MPYCTNCGKANPDEARFCSQCGTRLVAEGRGRTRPRPSASPAQSAPRSPPTASSTRWTPRRSTHCPVGSALLVVQRGPGAGSRFLLDKDVVTAGRHADSEIFLDDVTVSRRHATFTREGDTFSVADAGSLNGTYVNRDRIDTVVLKDTDEVQIGKYRLVFFQGHETP